MKKRHVQRRPLSFYDMGDKPLKHDVKCNTKVVIPAGTKGVQIAFRRSHLTRFDAESGKQVNLNIYLYKGRMYHA